MRALLLMSFLAVPASAASTPLFSPPNASEPIVSAPAADRSVINPNQRDASGLCPPTASQMAADRVRQSGGRDLFHKLTELPPANGYVAVYRRVDGCEAPIVVKYGLGRR